MNTNENSCAAASQIDSITPWSLKSLNDDRLTIQEAKLHFGYQPVENSEYTILLQIKQITSLGQLPNPAYFHAKFFEVTSYSRGLKREDGQRFLFHFLIELMPKTAYVELQDSMIEIYKYYMEASEYQWQLPATLPSLKGKLAEPQVSELIPLSEY